MGFRSLITNPRPAETLSEPSVPFIISAGILNLYRAAVFIEAVRALAMSGFPCGASRPSRCGVGFTARRPLTRGACPPGLDDLRQHMLLGLILYSSSRKRKHEPSAGGEKHARHAGPSAPVAECEYWLLTVYWVLCTGC